MDLLHLETFSRLVQQRSFSRVAKDLGVSQPTVTVRIKALEEELGIPLIVRVGHKVTVTPAGQVYYEHIERSMRVLKDGVDTISGSIEEQRTRLNMAVTPTVSSFFLPEILQKFYENNKCSITLDIGYTWEVIEMIMDEVAHVGFVSGDFNQPDVIKIPLYTDHFYMVAGPNHPLTSESSISITDLSKEALISYQKHHSMFYRIENLFREVGIKSNVIMELNNSNTIKQMVLEGNGIAFLPWIVVENDVNKGKLKLLPLEMPRPLDREISLIYHKKNHKLPQIRDILRVLDVTETL